MTPQRDQIQFEKAMHRDKPILEPPLSVPFAPPFIFDCRFYGAIYCRVKPNTSACSTTSRPGLRMDVGLGIVSIFR